MKKKIIITLACISLVFLAGGIYIASTIETATSTLDHLIKLHQVEILREHLLLQIKRVQSDLNLWDTPRARSIDTIIGNVKRLDLVSGTCFDCHHSPDVLARLNNLTRNIENFKDAFSRSLTLRANRQRLAQEADRAFHIADNLTAEVRKMVHMAASKLSDKTQSSLRDIFKTKILIYLLLIITPFFAIALGYFLIRALIKPVNVLLQATRKIKTGDLSFRIEGLKD